MWSDADGVDFMGMTEADIMRAFDTSEAANKTA